MAIIPKIRYSNTTRRTYLGIYSSKQEMMNIEQK